MDRRSFNRRMLLGGAAVATSLSAAPEAVGTTLRTAPAGGRIRRIRLYAEKLSGGRMGYGLQRGKATVPGPLIELTEGDTAYVQLVNTMDVPASLHVHGLDYTIHQDGTRWSWSAVQPGGTRTYVWRTHAPGRRADGTWREGSAGYWHYHDHIVGSDHGTGGVHKGLYGPVIVRRAGDILPLATHTIVFNDTSVNNRPPHSGPNFQAALGDRVEFVMITHGDLYHTFHMHGHRWANNRTGILAGPDDRSQIIDNRIVGPGDSFGFQVIAGEGVGAGAWMYHCHVQHHSDKGMTGLFLVKNPNGTIPAYEMHQQQTQDQDQDDDQDQDQGQGQDQDQGQNQDQE
ncbi:multicopper oxidase domain-containing protein [Streptomyces glomeratus]|uniref:Multicopper oxidase domain-containing protein n=1 Tax=Streptomyces glomeratus TaxID=284452 RepID=A0ABP6LSP3_9ACTN|nr:multicopper oxidase domain-containing protein [Streptomyces glomeratus]MCF1510807.1 multicopper oxidase domain-containing protein [Streptomyces glomeratus]